MAQENHKAPSDDWLKALSLLALLSMEVPEGRRGSAVIAAFVLVALSIYSRGVFQLLYVAATGFLIWAAVQSQQALLGWYAVLYTVLGVVLVAEGERRRLGKGDFLSAIWWAGQCLIHGLDIRHAYATGGASGFFTDLFFVISGVMALAAITRGIRALSQRGKARTTEGVEGVDTLPREALDTLPTRCHATRDVDTLPSGNGGRKSAS